MEKASLFALTCIASLSTLLALPSYASKENCPKDAVHCAYMTGLSNSLNDGRYIKLYHPKVGNLTVCFNGTSTAFIDQFGAGAYVGSNSDIYSICSDSAGKNCEQIGVDNFTVTKNKSFDYSAEPQYFNLDLTTLKNKYPACDSYANQKVKL